MIYELNQNYLEESDAHEMPLSGDIPSHKDVLPDGREVLVIGDVERCKEFNHRQGDNPYGYKGTCGLVSCEGILRRFGINVTESDVVKYAVEHNLCFRGDKFGGGGTTEYQQAKILTDYGVPAHPERIGSLERLAQYVSEGRGIITEVNAGVIWNDPNAFEQGQANHAIVVTGVSRDMHTGQIQGFYINDSGKGSQNSGRFVDAKIMENAWLRTGSNAVVTDKPEV